MSTVSELTHDTFIKNVNDKLFMEEVKNNQSVVLTGLINSMSNDDQLSKGYAVWLLEQMEGNYILALPGGLFQLINKDEKSTMVVTLRRSPKTIELANIHSLKKGEGKKMMDQLISISKKINVPISLWTETDKNVKYFSKYGFKSSGKIGDNNEHFMILNIDV